MKQSIVFVCFMLIAILAIHLNAQTAFNREFDFSRIEGFGFSELKNELSNHSRSIDSVAQRISDFQDRFINYKPKTKSISEFHFVL